MIKLFFFYIDELLTYFISYIFYILLAINKLFFLHDKKNVYGVEILCIYSNIIMLIMLVKICEMITIK
jgi:hypothetical protein